MTDLENLALSVEAYLKQNTTLSANDLAKMCGVSASYITHAINRNWDKIPAGKDKDGNPRYTSFSAEVSKKIALVVNLNKVRIWETSNYVTMFNVLTEAKLNKEHRIISGEKGSGKTFCCTKFVNQYPTETYLITCAGDMGVKDFLIELATCTGASPEGSRMMIRKSICKKLKTTSKALIIIDEAENLKPASYESIKAIYDDVKDYAGIVLVGANNYINTLRKRANAQKSCFPQLYSRFSAEYKELNLLTRDDIKRIATQEGILDKVQINKLCDMCTDYRELDRMIKRMLNDKHLINENL